MKSSIIEWFGSGEKISSQDLTAELGRRESKEVADDVAASFASRIDVSKQAADIDIELSFTDAHGVQARTVSVRPQGAFVSEMPERRAELMLYWEDLTDAVRVEAGQVHLFAVLGCARARLLGPIDLVDTVIGRMRPGPLDALPDPSVWTRFLPYRGASARQLQKAVADRDGLVELVTMQAGIMAQALSLAGIHRTLDGRVWRNQVEHPAAPILNEIRFADGWYEIRHEFSSTEEAAVTFYWPDPADIIRWQNHDRNENELFNDGRFQPRGDPAIFLFIGERFARHNF